MSASSSATNRVPPFGTFSFRSSNGRNVVIGYDEVCYGVISRYLGALAGTLERRDLAVRHFEDALAMNARVEAWPWLARTQFQYAEDVGIERTIRGARQSPRASGFRGGDSGAPWHARASGKG